MILLHIIVVSSYSKQCEEKSCISQLRIIQSFFYWHENEICTSEEKYVMSLKTSMMLSWLVVFFFSRSLFTSICNNPLNNLSIPWEKASQSSNELNCLLYIDYFRCERNACKMSSIRRNFIIRLELWVLPFDVIRETMTVRVDYRHTQSDSFFPTIFLFIKSSNLTWLDIQAKSCRIRLEITVEKSRRDESVFSSVSRVIEFLFYFNPLVLLLWYQTTTTHLFVISRNNHSISMCEKSRWIINTNRKKFLSLSLGKTINNQ